MLCWVILQADDYVETVLFIVSSFMLNDQSSDSVVLKAELQQQMYIWCSIIA